MTISLPAANDNLPAAKEFRDTFYIPDIRRE